MIKPATLTAYREAFGGSRCLVTVGAGFINACLLMCGYITGDQFVELILWTVGAFIAGHSITDFLAKRKAGGTNAPT